jgi:hypothetical protein
VVLTKAFPQHLQTHTLPSEYNLSTVPSFYPENHGGNYLWNQSDNTILGKKVVISNFMPSEEFDSTPIVFGDLSYYWIVCKSPLSVRALHEQFVVYD